MSSGSDGCNTFHVLVTICIAQNKEIVFDVTTVIIDAVNHEDMPFSLSTSCSLWFCLDIICAHFFLLCSCVTQLICYVCLSTVLHRCRPEREQEVKEGESAQRHGNTIRHLHCWQGFVASELKLLSLGTNQNCEIDSVGLLCSKRWASAAIHSTLTSNDFSCCSEHMLIGISTEAFSSPLREL